MAFADEPVPSTDREAVDTTCAKDGSVAKCDGKLIGRKLAMCIKAHAKADPTFVVSDDCKAAMKQMHDDKKAAEKK